MDSKKMVYSFKKGQKIHLDEIYNIQGLGHDWYEEDFNPEGREGITRRGLTDFLVVTKDIKITITVKQSD